MDDTDVWVYFIHHCQGKWSKITFHEINSFKLFLALLFSHFKRDQSVNVTFVQKLMVVNKASLASIILLFTLCHSDASKKALTVFELEICIFLIAALCAEPFFPPCEKAVGSESPTN